MCQRVQMCLFADIHTPLIRIQVFQCMIVKRNFFIKCLTQQTYVILKSMNKCRRC